MQQTSEHIQSLHKEEMDDFGLSSVVSWCAVRTYGITSCPLCTDQGPEDAPELVDHVLSHAYDFALRSLPWTQTPSEDLRRPVGSYNVPEGQEEADRLMKWVQNLSNIVKDDDMMKHHLYIHRSRDDSSSTKDLCIEEEEYFAQHDYFEQRSMDDCSRGKAARSGSISLSRWTNNTSIQQGNDDTSTKHDSSEEDRSSEDLADSLARRAEQSVFDRKQFWPCGSIDEIITRETVRERLSFKTRKADQESLESLADFISKRSKKIFAIMLCSNLSNKQIRLTMAHFEKSGFDDENLPLTGDDVTRLLKSSTGKGYKKPWNAILVAAFCSRQWEFLAPVFDNNQSEMVLHSNQILPFTWASQRGSSGTFGQVHEVTIHPAHLKNVSHVRPNSFACMFNQRFIEHADMCSGWS